MSWLLIRGLSREQRHWGAFPEILAAALGEEVRGIDPPGFGTEAARRSPGRLSDITDDIRCRFDPGRGSDTWSILGISLGGMVALDWCARHPGDFERCVVVNTSTRLSPFWSRFRPGTVPTLVGARLRRGTAGERATLAVSVNRPDHDLDALAQQYTQWTQERTPSQASLRGQIIAATRFHAPERIETPVLVLTSEGDRLVSPSCSRRLAEHLGAPIVVHPDAGHDLALDDPHWIAQQIKNHQW